MDFVLNPISFIILARPKMEKDIGFNTNPLKYMNVHVKLTSPPRRAARPTDAQTRAPLVQNRKHSPNKKYFALLVEQVALMQEHAHDARALVASMHERTDTNTAREPPRRA